MAGDYNGHRVTMVRHPDGAKTLRPADRASNVGIAASLAVGNGAQRLPARPLKFCSAQIKREGERAPLTREIFFELLRVRPQSAGRFLDAQCLALLRPVLRPHIAGVRTNRLLAGQAGIKLQRHQAKAGSGQKQGAYRGRNRCGMKNFHTNYRVAASRLRHHHSTRAAFELPKVAESIDRTGFFDESVSLQFALAGSSSLKKALIVLAAVVLAPVLVVSLVVFAAGDWRPIGQTDAGDRVSVSSVRILKNNQRIALVRVEYNKPALLPQGGPFVEMRARVRFNCASGAVAPTTEWFYSRDHSGRFVVSKKATHDDQFGKNPEGGFAAMVSQSVCSQAK